MKESLQTSSEEEPKAFEDDLMVQVRSKFCHVDHDPYNGRRIFLESAGGALTLKSVMEATTRDGGLPDNVGRDNPASRHLGDLVEAGLKDVATFLGATDGTILTGQSTTGNCFRILEVVTANLPGDNIVCTNLDHPSSYNATRHYAQVRSLDWRVARLDPVTGRITPDALIDVIDRGTVAVTLIHASNIIGVVNEIGALIEAIRDRAPQAIIMVDGAQHAQHGVVDVDALGADAYTFAAYKVYLRPGTSFAYLGPRIAELPHPNLEGRSANAWDLGAIDFGAPAGFSAMVNHLCWLGACRADDRRRGIVAGMKAIASHEAALSGVLLHGDGRSRGLLRLPGVQLFGDPTIDQGREAVFAIVIGRMDAREIVRRCREAGIIVHCRFNDAIDGHILGALGTEQVLRVSLGHYNTLDEINAFLHVMGEICS